MGLSQEVRYRLGIALTDDRLAKELADTIEAALVNSGGAASGISFDPTASGLSSTDVQDAIDELAGMSGGSGANTNLSNLDPTAINQALVAAAFNINVGSGSIPWLEGFFNGINFYNGATNSAGFLSGANNAGGSGLYMQSNNSFRIQALTGTILLIAPQGMDIDGKKIINLADPNDPTDAANRRFVDGSGTTPTIQATVNAGTGATVSLENATNKKGVIVFTPDSTDGTPGPQLTVTFSTPFAVPPIVMKSEANEQAAIGGAFWITSTVNDFTIHTNGGLTDVEHRWNYMIME